MELVNEIETLRRQVANAEELAVQLRVDNNELARQLRGVRALLTLIAKDAECQRQKKEELRAKVGSLEKAPVGSF